VLLGSVSVNLEQMRGGFAWYFKRYAADVSEIERLQYEAAEVEAKEAKRGLWQRQAMPPWEWRAGCHFAHKLAVKQSAP
jgi:endonuclease YncB( thermonuclease family)